jgi:transposase
LDLVWNRDYSLSKKGQLSIITINNGRIKVDFHKKYIEQYLNNLWKFGTAKVYIKNNDIYLLVPVTKKIPKFDINNTKDIIGVDLGINFSAVSYDSNKKTIFYKGRKLKDKRSQFVKTRKDLQKRGTASARRRLDNEKTVGCHMRTMLHQRHSLQAHQIHH